jgi:quinol monooxygenase YgiN
MTLHPSLDGSTVVVYAQWASAQALRDAANQSAVKAARAQLDTHGEPDGTTFAVDSVHSAPDLPASLPIEASPHRLTFINVWTTPGEPSQHGLLDAMKTETASILAKSGALGMAFHASHDHTRLVVYALWENLEAFDNAITNDRQALRQREHLAHYGTPHPNTYRVDAVLLPS